MDVGGRVTQEQLPRDHRGYRENPVLRKDAKLPLLPLTYIQIGKGAKKNPKNNCHGGHRVHRVKTISCSRKYW